MTARVAGPERLTVHVPLRIRKHGGRKRVLVPDSGQDGTQRPRVDHTMVKALARAFRWRKMLESGQFATLKELADHERIAPSYLTRVLQLTLLAPDIVERILDGQQGPEVTMARLLTPLPLKWERQLWSPEPITTSKTPQTPRGAA